MSDKQLDQLVREAREDVQPREVKAIDWAKLDAQLFGRLEKDRRAEQRSSV